MKGDPPAAIQVSNVSKSFGSGMVVDRVSFDVPWGSCFGLLGTNGAGKTTILKMIYGFLRPTSGGVTVNGTDAALHPGEVRKSLGIAPQDDLLDPDLTVTENLLFHARYFRMAMNLARERTERLKDFMGLTAHGDDPVGHLSTGLRRRLVLTRALLSKPDILILDEPTRGLDHESRRRYIDRLRELKAGGATLVMATHELREAEALCDHVAVLERGGLLETGPLEEILSLRPRKAAAPAAEGEPAC